MGEIRQGVRKNVMMIVTNRCSLNCVYCYEKYKTSEEMTFATAKSIIDEEMAADDGYEEIIFDFFGGEPFLNFPLIKRAHDYLHSKTWPKKYLCFTTTNGLHIHGDVANWLWSNRRTFWCSLSLDGTPGMHNQNRNNSYDQINVDFFAKAWPDQPVKMTISRQTLPHLADGIIFLHRKGFKVTSTFAQGINWIKETDLPILERELKKLMVFYKANPEFPLAFLLDYPIHALCRELPREEKWCGCGESMKAYFVDGTLYPCQCFTPLANETSREQIYESIDFKQTATFVCAECTGCPYLPICPTCYGSNYIQRGSMGRRDQSLCAFYRACIDASAQFRATQIIHHHPTPEELTPEEYYVLKGTKLLHESCS
ncbi:radical SAM protein with 4Fe4S-binding SPASM domain [Desulfitobacterium sp. LBE]|uniref:Radical SAM protein n=1 Tax=Desulfitobacterium hafniense TaxID=49338 RepID=A0A0W1JLP1_DESHA|nr:MULTISPECIES: radical SAM protein [Desulfitobacterium]KTE92072.1 radical SAM protein [Desulfitobacterium hafniense]TWH59975.1 radical SAM protein with 4Fe4S-binding SPASM domain [Desulfitobacterium sp. LBE]